MPFDTTPITIRVDGLGEIVLQPVGMCNTTVHINGKCAWTYMLGIKDTERYVRDNMRRWKYINEFKAS